MKRAVMLLAIGIMGTGCVVESEPTATVRWEFSRTVYDQTGRAFAEPYDCERAGVDYIDVVIVEPDGRRVTPVGSPFTCRDYLHGVTIEDFQRARYGFEVFAYRSMVGDDLLLFDAAVSTSLGGGDNVIVVSMVPYQGDLVLEAEFPGFLSPPRCPPDADELTYSLVDGYGTPIAAGSVVCTDPPGVSFPVDLGLGLDLDIYAVRMQGFDAFGTLTYDSCTVSFDHYASSTAVGIPMHVVTTTTPCPSAP